VAWTTERQRWGRIAARGTAFAGTNLFVQLGRGTNYAWSATSAGGDNVDQWVLELCDPDGSDPTLESQHYRNNGECREMETWTQEYFAKPTAGGFPPTFDENPIFVQDEIERSVYGPVIARGTRTCWTMVSHAPLDGSSPRSAATTSRSGIRTDPTAMVSRNRPTSSTTTDPPIVASSGDSAL
jgi:acyl-homoserine lactone acylase PvdQ